MSLIRGIAVLLASGCLAAACATAQTPASSAAEPTTAAASGPASQPASAPAGKVLATVGQVKIDAAALEESLRAYQAANGPIPQEAMPKARKALLGKLIERELLTAYMKALPPPTEEELAAMKGRMAEKLKAANQTLQQWMQANRVTEEVLATEAKYSRLEAQTTSPDKIAAFIKDNPAYFDGTRVRASHILLNYDLLAPQAVKDEARAKLQQLAADIQAGKIAFEDAARKFSACPSAQKGGDLDMFTLDRMVPQFSAALLALKVNEISGPVETPFGLHLIKLTERNDGNGKAGPSADETARRILMSNMQDRVLRQAIEKNPVVILEQ